MSKMRKKINNRVVVPMKFSISQLERIAVALLNNNGNKKFAGNVRLLFGMFDRESYQNEYEKEIRVYLIEKISDLIIKEEITEKESILSLLNLEGRFEADCIEILNSLFDNDLKDEEMTVLDKTISDQLRYNFLEQDADEIIELLTNLKAENFGSLSKIVEELTSSINSLQKKLRESNESIENAKKKVSLSSSSLEMQLAEIIDEEKNPASKIRTGIKALNELLSGGFEKGRLYMALAVAKGWKSSFLLNACLWAKKYNEFTLKDPTKKPVILYLTMENSIKETIKRIFYATFGNDYKFNGSPREALEELKRVGIFSSEDENSPEIVLEYRSNKSINTNDLLGMIEEYERNGKEVVFVVLDYLKRIRSTSPNKEIRLELGQITDELAAMAKEKDIPILSASQLNREAFRAIDEAENFESKISAINRMGSANIGESIDIVQNVDCAFILNRLNDIKYNETGDIEYADRYLSVKLIATRTKPPRFNEFKHPFKMGYDLALVEDINSPLSSSITSDQDLIKASSAPIKTSGRRRIS